MSASSPGAACTLANHLSLSLPSSIHNLGLVGHIEDIAVAKDQQGKKLGLRIIQALDYVAEKVGCYKVSALSVRGPRWFFFF